jgi:flagellar hook protein FlgE
MQFSSGRLSTLNGESVTSLNPPTLQLSGVDPFNPSATIELSLDGSTQFSGTSRVLSRTEDGYPPGELVGVSFGSGGEMVASYSNDVDRTVGVVALATFASDSGLEPSGSNEWMASQASGDAILDVPGTGTRGSISSRELESSNVDLTAQLIALIQAQQNYQANSKTIEAQDSLIQTILQIS